MPRGSPKAKWFCLCEPDNGWVTECQTYKACILQGDGHGPHLRNPDQQGRADPDGHTSPSSSERRRVPGRLEDDANLNQEEDLVESDNAPGSSDGEWSHSDDDGGVYTKPARVLRRKVLNRRREHERRAGEAQEDSDSESDHRLLSTPPRQGTPAAPQTPGTSPAGRVRASGRHGAHDHDAERPRTSMEKRKRADDDDDDEEEEAGPRGHNRARKGRRVQPRGGQQQVYDPFNDLNQPLQGQPVATPTQPARPLTQPADVATPTPLPVARVPLQLVNQPALEGSLLGNHQPLNQNGPPVAPLNMMEVWTNLPAHLQQAILRVAQTLQTNGGIPAPGIHIGNNIFVNMLPAETMVQVLDYLRSWGIGFGAFTLFVTAYVFAQWAAVPY